MNIMQSMASMLQAQHGQDRSEGFIEGVKKVGGAGEGGHEGVRRRAWRPLQVQGKACEV